MSFIVSASAYGDQFNVFGNATTFWDTLKVTTDPGVSISWLGTSNQTEAIQFFDSATVGDQSNPNWNPLSYSNQIGGAVAAGEATSQNISSTIVWSAYPPSGTDWMNVQKGGNFQVTGSGNVMFTIEYSLAADRLVDASSLTYPFIETGGVMEADLLLYIPFVQGLDYSQHFMLIPTVEGSVNDSLSQTGTASVSYYLNNGQTYWIQAESHSRVTVGAPEPSSLALLGFGLFGIFFSQRARKGFRLN
jgi:hypothetical protein